MFESTPLFIGWIITTYVVSTRLVAFLEGFTEGLKEE